MMDEKMTLIGYAWPKPPKVIFSATFADRELLWKAGYSVDAIPEAIAQEIIFMIG